MRFPLPWDVAGGGVRGGGVSEALALGGKDPGGTKELSTRNATFSHVLKKQDERSL